MGRQSESAPIDPLGWFDSAGLQRIVAKGVDLYGAAVEEEVGRWTRALDRLGRGDYGPTCAVQDSIDAWLAGLGLGADLTRLGWEELEAFLAGEVAEGECLDPSAVRSATVTIRELGIRKADNMPEVTLFADLQIAGADGATVKGRFIPDVGVEVPAEAPIKGGKARVESAKRVSIKQHFKFIVDSVGYEGEPWMLTGQLEAKKTLGMATVKKNELGCSIL